ncbi:MAG: glycosyltransferase family 39 protein [Ignavibacteriales bacterium]|nr:glycosyltransferase family 39 protein [Ignavibacteriales bacterium]
MTTKTTFTKPDFASVAAIIIYLMAFKVILHLLLPEYGYHRDEFYYISVGDQFSFSNLDMLPLSPLYLKFITLVFGYSIKAIHLASSLLGAVSLLLTCLMTKELGGNKYAIFLAGVFFLFSGFTVFGSLFTYDSIDFLVIVTVLYLLVKIFKTDHQKLWLYVGAVLGLGLMNKLTILFYGLAIFVSLWLVPQRKIFKTKYIWIAGIIALLFLTPYLLWQSNNNWYFLGFAASYAGGISYLASFPEFVWNQILPNNLIALPVWLTGLILLLFSSRWKTYRFFGIMYLFLFLLFYVIGAKLYFLFPMYPILLSIGSMKLEEKISNLARTRIAVPIVYVLLSLPLLPMWVPLLPVERFIDYAKMFGVDAGVRYENLRLNQLPQHFADRFGWEDLVRQISEVYHKIPQEERINAGVLTSNWGIASAVHVYKEKYDLPEPTSDAGWYYYESLRRNSYKNHYVCVGYTEGTLRHLFQSVSRERIFTHPYCMPHENNRPIFLCMNTRVDIGQYFKVEQHIDPEFLTIMRRDGPQKAIEFYRERKSADSRILLFTENQINSIGYWYLGNNMEDEALIVFTFNVEEYPESFNVYDSLGEAYMTNGDTMQAIVNYEKSLQLNPGNDNAKKMLEQLQK